MYSRKLDMLHDRGNEYMLTVAYRIRLTLKRVIKETVDKYRTVGCYADSSRHVDLHMLVVVYDFHSASAEYV